jgi:hypothetical protein
LSFGHAWAADARTDAALRAARWIASQQKSNGAYFSSTERVDLVAETLAALVAGGGNGSTVDKAFAYMRNNGPDGATRGAYTGRIIAGIVAGGGDPRSFGGHDYVAVLNNQYDPSTGAYDTGQSSFFSNLVAANGELAATGSLPDRAIAYIEKNECGDGGFGYAIACEKGPDVDTTAWAIDVLVAAGRASDPAVGRARDILVAFERTDGGFGFTKDKTTSSDSTGLALSAVAALHENPTTGPWRQSDGDDPVHALLALQDGSGGFRFVAGSKPNGMSTTNALPGLAGIAYPVPERGQPAASPLPTTPSSASPPASGATTPRPSGYGSDPTATTTPSATPGSTSQPQDEAARAQSPPPAAAPFSGTSERGGGGLPFIAWIGIGVVAAAGGSLLARWVILRSQR